ncbi:hypothetical protein [Candidatus Regiella insecticola]|uniref:hypothetical protein n=1 Tax=Candidatus Regiella insecticola TaxID=138073 RepID=UPI0015966281|nr:hypothetical protein [Candidatus Regiella insecticola]
MSILCFLPPYFESIYILLALLEQEVVDITSRLAKGEGEFKVFGDKRFLWVTDDLSLTALLTAKNLKKEFKLKPLTWGLTKKEMLSWAAFLVFLLIAFSFFNRYQQNKEHKARLLAIEKQKLADDINKAAR